MVADDGSAYPPEKDYAVIAELAGVRVLRQPTNTGRARIRNLLADAAQYPYLLFIDCDAELVAEDFIAQYIRAAGQVPVVCGGTVYPFVAPADSVLHLRWHYGRYREMRTAAERAENRYRSFSSFNFLISSDCFQQIRFDTSISRYGHEDTLFGIELERRQIAVLHIDAPLLHAGLEPAGVFVGKTEQAVRNLWQLFCQEQLRPYLSSGSSLVATFEMAQRLRLAGAAGMLYMLLRRPMRWIVIRANCLRLLDLYKLGLLCLISRTDAKHREISQ